MVLVNLMLVGLAVSLDFEDTAAAHQASQSGIVSNAALRVASLARAQMSEMAAETPHATRGAAAPAAVAPVRGALEEPMARRR